MSKTISITLPDPLEKLLQMEANKTGISRSRFISNILLKWQDNLHTNIKSKPNDCDHRNDNGYCNFFEQVCQVNQKGAETCAGYYKGDN